MVIDKAYSARRLRARAGTVVTPGPLFLFPRGRGSVTLGRFTYCRPPDVSVGLGTRAAPSVGALPSAPLSTVPGAALLPPMRRGCLPCVAPCDRAPPGAGAEVRP